MSQNEVKNYFKSFLTPTQNKVHPDTGKQPAQNQSYDKSSLNLNGTSDDPTTTIRFQRERDSLLKSPRSPGPNLDKNDMFNQFKKTSTIAYRGSRASNINFPNFSSEKFRKSVVNLSKIVGQVAKNVFTDMNVSQKQYELNDAYIKSLDSAFRYMDGSKSPFLNLLKQIIFFNIQILIFLLTLLCVINIILVTDYRLKILDESYERPLMVSEWVVGMFLGFEVILIMISNEGISKKIRALFTFPVYGNILLIMEIFTTTLIGNNFIRIHKIFILMYIPRSFKLYKLRNVIQFTLKEFRKMMRKDKFEIVTKNEQAELKNFVYNSALDIVIGIFIEATFFISIDEFLDYDGYISSNGDTNFNYIDACYFSIVSITTIGYGDIYPYHWASRFFHVFILFLNITIISNFIGKMSEKMYELSPYIRDFYFRNHIVIIGDLPLTFCKYFIKELHQCDVLTSTVYNNNDLKKVKLSKIILVGKENPTSDFDVWMEAFSNDFAELKYLKANVLEGLWHKQANLGGARHLFAFSMNPNENQAQGFESDKQMAYNIQNVINMYPKLDITLILSTEFSYHVKNDSLWSKVTLISPQILNESIMANSLENQGLNIWLTHLATLREKTAPVQMGSDLNHLEEYAENMGQEIYPISKLFIFIS